MTSWKNTVQLVNYGAAILGASLIVEDLDINDVALGFESRYDAVVGSNVIPVVA